MNLFVAIRKRLGSAGLEDINKLIHKNHIANFEQSEAVTEIGEKKFSGSLMVDATVSPADIHYPTDGDLLNTAREKTEKLIDALWLLKQRTEKKPRTYGDYRTSSATERYV